MRILTIVTLAIGAALLPAVAPAAQKAGPSISAKTAELMEVVATVNGEDISMNELANECLLHYGEDVLERMTKKYLIIQECQKYGIEVTQEEINEEIHRMATRFSLPVDQWLKMLKDERGINPAQYSNDIIWPTLALKKIAADQLQVTEQELRVEYEKYYGPSVRARMISCKSEEKALRLHAAVTAQPAEFGNIAKNESEDLNSASAKGLVNPIRRHLGYKEIEDAAFVLADDQISQVIHVADQYVILKCEGHIPARNIDFAAARENLEEGIRDAKLHTAANELFARLQSQAQVVNVFNDPEKSKKMPGVAAVINGKDVKIEDLAKMCIERHGSEVLGGTINRRLIEQECKRKNVTISKEEIDAEIAKAAGQMLAPRPDGTPDIQKWLTLATEQQGISEEVYRRDAVWPSVALRKLVGSSVKVTNEDLQRGFEANFGPRVRCLAIVLDNHRRAQEVWKLAKANPTAEFFGDLAEQHSIEQGSRALRGEVPPIQKHGGQPILEKEAFALSQGELSSIIQTGQRFAILLCLGHTTPEPVDLTEVRDEIYRDIHEKKMGLAMGNMFQTLQDQATINNFITHTSQSPRKAKVQPQTAVKPVDMRTFQQ